MSCRDLVILTGDDVKALLEGMEARLIDVVRRAYVSHANEHSSLPHSTFLRFPNNASDRIIALPAYLGDDCDTAGVKWVASFPGNLAKGLGRASAVIVLNSMENGRPLALIEGSLINAKRTAASAALGALSLASRDVERVAMLGCGVINLEIVRFLLVAFPELSEVTVFDLDRVRATRFAHACRELSSRLDVRLADDSTSLLAAAPLISIATTAAVPHISTLSATPLGATILHVSLRDLSPRAILCATNVVDDVDHVCRASTSVHLTEQEVGHRRFITGTLGDVLRGAVRLDEGRTAPLVFSPFGLGILDIAVGKLVYELGQERGLGHVIESFIPRAWDEPVETTRSAARAQA